MSHAHIRRYLKHGTLPQIAVFEAIARLGSYTRAAAELHMAQPTVSTQIKKLSDSIGLPLFELVGKRVYLTDAGRTLYAACSEIFTALSQLEHSFAALRGAETGRLQLAVGTSASFMPAVLAGFARHYPGVEISLRFCNRDELARRLANNADDVYLFSTAPELNVVKQALLPNPLVACARADHPLACELAIPFARMAQEPFLLREPGSGTRAAVERLFERHGAAPDVRMELSSDAAICQGVHEGSGVAIVSQHALAPDGALVVLDVDTLPLAQHWYFVYPAGKQLSRAAQALIALARTLPATSAATPPASTVDVPRKAGCDAVARDALRASEELPEPRLVKNG